MKSKVKRSKAKGKFLKKMKKFLNRKSKDKIVNKSTSHVGTIMNFGKTPFPQRLRVKLRYCETFLPTTGALGVNGTQIPIRLNSLVSPNGNNAGHQPYLYDQTWPMYNRYKVYSAKVSLIWSTVGNANADIQTAYALFPSTGGVNLAGMNVDRCAEINTITTGLVSPSGNTRTVKQSVYVPLHKVEGLTKQQYKDEENYSGVNGNSLVGGSNPANSIYLNLAVGSPSGVAGEACAVQVIVDYYAVLYERVVQSQS